MSPRAHPLATGLIPTDDSASGLVLEERFELSRPGTPGSKPGASSSSATRAQAAGRIGGGGRRSRSPDPEVRTAFETGLVLDQFVFPQRRGEERRTRTPVPRDHPAAFDELSNNRASDGADRLRPIRPEAPSVVGHQRIELRSAGQKPAALALASTPVQHLCVLVRFPFSIAPAVYRGRSCDGWFS